VSLTSIKNIIHYFCTSLLSSIGSLIFPMGFSLEAFMMLNYLISIALDLILFVGLGWMLYRFASSPLHLSKPEIIKKLCLAPITLYVLCELYYQSDFVYGGDDMLINHIISLSYMLIFTVSSFYIFISLYRMHIGNEKNKQVERQLELLGAHYTHIQSNMEETKRAHHDLRHHLSVFQAYISTGETEKLAEYIKEYKESLPDETEFRFCKNNAVNVILMHYISIARKEGIQVDVKIDLTDGTGISDTDLSIIFGNTVENAIEANRKVNKNKFISIRAGITGKIMTITIDNSFDGIVCKNGETFISTKRKTAPHEAEKNEVAKNSPASGIGISSVEAVARKYNGEALFEVDNNVFRASVILRGV